MKKYMKPEMVIVEMQYVTTLQSGSPVLGNEYTGGQVLAPALDGDLIYE